MQNILEHGQNNLPRKNYVFAIISKAWEQHKEGLNIFTFPLRQFVEKA